MPLRTKLPLLLKTSNRPPTFISGTVSPSLESRLKSPSPRLNVIVTREMPLIFTVRGPASAIEKAPVWGPLYLDGGGRDSHHQSCAWLFFGLESSVYGTSYGYIVLGGASGNVVPVCRVEV